MAQKTPIAPGIYFGMPEEEYFSAKGLSASGMKQLAVSPLSYWHHNLNPQREQPEETYAQRWGKAMHCRLLEPARFAGCYAAELDKADLEGALDTMDEMKVWLAAQGLPTTAKKKQDLVERIQQSGIPATILEVERERHALLHAGKRMLSKAEMARLDKAAGVVLDDPYARYALSDGEAEASFIVPDPETGVLLKARMDYLLPSATVDLKTFSNSRGKPIDKAIHEAIYYEGYHVQCVFYHQVREIARRLLAAGEIAVHGEVPASWAKEFLAHDQHAFAFVFIESAEPFELLVKQLKRAEAPGAGANVYWRDAEIKIDNLKTQYAQCLKKYGDSPWREATPPRVLQDTDIPQLMFA